MSKEIHIQIWLEALAAALFFCLIENEITLYNFTLTLLLFLIIDYVIHLIIFKIKRDIKKDDEQRP